MAEVKTNFYVSVESEKQTSYANHTGLKKQKESGPLKQPAVGRAEILRQEVQRECLRHSEHLHHPERLRHSERLHHPERLRHPERLHHPECLRHSERLHHPECLHHPERLRHSERLHHPECLHHPERLRHPERLHHPECLHHSERLHHPECLHHPERLHHPECLRHSECLCHHLLHLMLVLPCKKQTEQIRHGWLTVACCALVSTLVALEILAGTVLIITIQTDWTVS
nr:histidine-rich glycoprotein-like [Aotus nancymaae]